MRVHVDKENSVKRHLTVTISADEVDKKLGAIYKKLAKTANLKGFRKGKAPRAILERYYGPQASAEAAEAFISESYPQALEETGIEPVARPDFDFPAPMAGEDFVFTVDLDVQPQFDLDPESYKGLELKEPDLAVTDEEVEEKLASLRERHAVVIPLEEPRPAQAGDVVIVDYQSFVDDEPLEGGTAENVEVELGSGKAQEEIEVALVKASIGDEVTATVHYDEEAANEKVAGKDIRFVMQVKDIKTKSLPDLDDDFARTVSPEFDTLDELKERIRSESDKAYEEQRKMAVRRQVLDAIRDLGEFDIPETLVREEVEGMVEEFKRRLKSSGMDPEAAGLDDEKLAEDYQEPARQKVRAGIVLSRISDLEKVEVEEADLEAEYERIAERVGQSAAIIKEMYMKNNMIGSLAAQVAEEKTLQAILADATITKVDPAELAGDTQKSGAGS